MILFVDTETTDQLRFDLPDDHPFQPRMVQVAAILMDERWRERASFSCLLRPALVSPPDHREWEISDGAHAVHGISTRDCIEMGLDGWAAIVAIDNMLSRCGRLVAHNIDFDARIIGIEYIRRGQPRRVWPERYCTMKRSTDILRLPGPYGYKWPKLAEAYRHFFGRELQGAHDALADVRACAEIYWRLMDWAEDPAVRQLGAGS